jgi:DUF917 family protein
MIKNPSGAHDLQSIGMEAPTVAMILDESNLAQLARGCAVLGGGGGGDPEIALVMSILAVRKNGGVRVVDLDDLDDEGLVMPCGLIGSPTVTVEKIWSGDEGVVLRDVVEGIWRRPVAAIMCYEIAGSNGLLPVAWAANLGLPILDADGMSRAFPEMQQQTMHLAGVSASPLVMVDEHNNRVILETVTNRWAERLARRVVATFGGVAAATLYQMPVAEARSSVSHGSLSRALAIGEALSRAAGDPIGALTEAVGAVELLSGKVIDVNRRSTGGFARGFAVVEGTGPYAGELLRIELQNEALVALRDGEVVATVPDIISVLDSHTGDAIGTERLRYGQNVSVVALSSDPAWKTDAGLQVAGPQAFGYQLPYVPFNGVRLENGGEACLPAKT